MALVGLSQPAWAVCINRGGAVSCVDDSRYEPVEGDTTVMQPDAASADNAWVMTSDTTDGATVMSPGVAVAAAAACEPGTNC
jgi:hypothetical protein